MNFESSKKQFDENFQLFGNPRTEPEKYNLYAGLSNLSTGLAELRSKIENIEYILAQINHKLK